MIEEVLASDQVYSGRVLALQVDRVRLDGGRETLREVVRHPSSVGILVRVGSRVLLVRQFRHATGEELLEIPAGKMEPGEEPEAAARRELREETGAEAESFVRLGSFYTSPGFTNEVMHLFLAEGVQMRSPDPDVDEEIENVWMEEAEALRAVRDGRIRDGKTALALLLGR